jgi:SAM-dependent methyltransferase
MRLIQQRKMPSVPVRRIDKLRMQLTSLPPFWRDERTTGDPNALFSRQQCAELRGHIQRLVHGDQAMLVRLSDRRIAGLRSWEYGTLLAILLDRPERRSWRALDIGSGASTFPQYLVTSGNVREMTTLDLPDPSEPPDSHHRPPPTQEEQGLAYRLKHVEGSMLELPFAAEGFDLVASISAIEHLDGDRHAHRRDPVRNPRLPYGEYVERTSEALMEMARVLAPGGLLYVTSDAYVPDLQRTDAWSSKGGGNEIWSAYHFGDIERVFVETLRSAGLQFVGQPDFRQTLLIDDPDRSTYRGRYFTTFAIAATK